MSRAGWTPTLERPGMVVTDAAAEYMVRLLEAQLRWMKGDAKPVAVRWANCLLAAAEGE